MDEDIPIWLRVLVISANVIGFIYNIPQVVLTIRTKKTNDISGSFLCLRFISSIMWIIYCSYVFSLDVLISWIITGTSSSIILYYKYIYPKCINNISIEENV